MKNLCLILIALFMFNFSMAQIGLLDNSYIAKLPGENTGIFHTGNGQIEFRKDDYPNIQIGSTGILRINEGHLWTESTSYNFGTIVNLGNVGVVSGPQWNVATAGLCPVDTLGSAAGFFSGDVEIYGSLYFPSDKNLKKDIRSLENILPKIMELNPTEYEYLEKYNWANGYQTGLIAQELKEVFPHLVSKRNMMLLDDVGAPNGEMQKINAINYVGLISILTKGIQEQQQIINDQETRLLELENKMERLLGNENTNPQKENWNENQKEEIFLSQNFPNPFGTTTTIKYRIPSTMNSAFLNIQSLDGKQLKRIEISAKRNGQVELNLQNIPKGIYFYSLESDGQILMTKKMQVGF